MDPLNDGRRPDGEKPALLVVTKRPTALPAALMPAIVLAGLATLLLALRAAVPDWQGASLRPPRVSLASLFPGKPAKPQAAKPRPKDAAQKDATPAPAGKDPKAAAPAEKSEDAKQALDDIQREADRKKAEREDLDRLKDRAEKKLKQDLSPRGNGFAGRPVDPREMQRRMQRAQEAQKALRDQFARMERGQRQSMEQFHRDALRHMAQMRAQHEAMMRGFGNGNFGAMPGFPAMPPRPMPGPGRGRPSARRSADNRRVPPPPEPGPNPFNNPNLQRFSERRALPDGGEAIFEGFTFGFGPN